MFVVLRMTLFLCAFTLMPHISLSTDLSYITNETVKSWRKCDVAKSKKCTAVRDECGRWKAINAKHAKLADKYYKMQSTEFCPDGEPTSLTPEVRCRPTAKVCAITSWYYLPVEGRYSHSELNLN